MECGLLELQEGVGAGKSAILAHLASKPGIRVMLADEIANMI